MANWKPRKLQTLPKIQVTHAYSGVQLHASVSHSALKDMTKMGEILQAKRLRFYLFTAIHID